ncbi:MAG: ribosome small subunit-dependent GTPase A [Flavobacteriales bacterium]|jgi:ribosome biogenesis GTPase|nr:ribosome small subunit-dependent GTPase A [Flavobacteriales bacterium]
MPQGLVLKSTGKWYDVLLENGTKLICQVRGKIRMEGRSTTNPVAAGDIVDVELENEQEGNIIRIHPRKNYIIRKSVNLSKEAQIIASNLDQAILVITITRPQTTPGFIDRFLVTADAYDIPVVLAFHKMDQYDEHERHEVNALIANYEKIGYSCLRTSLVDGTGIKELESILENKTSLISGHSATGKSSIINHMIPGIDLKTGEVSEASNKGQHTTTFAEMHPLPNGGYIVDTPGIKGFGLVDIPKDELHHHFIEFFALLPECKYHNCIHLNEPGCAVRKALDAGELVASRYNSYVSMYHDEEERSVYRN